MAYQIGIIMINSGTMTMKHMDLAPYESFGRVFRSETTWGIIYISNESDDISGTILEFRYSNVRRFGFCLKIIEPPLRIET